MQTLKTLLTTLLCLALVTTYSCGKKKGCTDPTSLNYDATAEKDDGSCIADPRTVYLGTYLCTDSAFDASHNYVGKTNFTTEVKKDESDDSKIIFDNFKGSSEEYSGVVTSLGDFSFTYDGIAVITPVTGTFGSNNVHMEYTLYDLDYEYHHIYGTK